MDKLIRDLALEWKNNAPNDFAIQARKALKEYKPKTEKKLINPLNNYQVALSHLKSRCTESENFHDDMDEDVEALEKQYPDSKEWVEWNAADTLYKKLELQKKWRWEGGLKTELAKLDIVPPQLKALKLTDEEHKAYQAVEEERRRKKLAVAMTFDLDEMMKTVMPLLEKKDIRDVVPALLLATGRRTVEIMKTAVFTRISKYRVKFTGQVKKREVKGDGSYDIDLLAPAESVINAMTWLRQNHDTTKMTNEQTNEKYSRKINTAVKKRCKGVKPHDLRGINAVGCRNIWGMNQSLIGYMQAHLGHQSAESTAQYQTFEVKVSAPWGEEKKESKEAEMGLTAYTKPHKMKIEQIADMMKKGLPITVVNIRRLHGGTHEMIRKAMAHGDNAKVIANYNDGLKAKAEK